MSDQSTFQLPPESPDDSEAIRNMRAHIKALEADRAKGAEDAAAAATLAKENTFLKAGIDLNDPVAKLLFDTYSGDLEVASVKEAAVALRLTPGATPPPPDPAGQQDPGQTQARADLANDSAPGSTLPEEDPIEAGYKDFHAELARGSSREDASAAVIGRIIAAGNAGDPRFKFDAQEWTSQAEAKSR